MVDPVVALVVFAGLTLLVAIISWPRRGLAARIIEFARNTERVRVEDALKHLYNCEYEGRVPTLESLAGALEVSRGTSADLVSTLQRMNLVGGGGTGMPLTAEGRRYALRILRSHRLWERYLADRTNTEPMDWHDEAERREHTLSAADTDGLAARMGYPRYDPHGDPIPLSSGELPPRSGVPLTSLSPGQSARIVHIEDEPRDVYHKLVAEGLSPNLELRLLDREPNTIRFLAQGTEHALETVVAHNVTVRVLVPTESPSEAVTNLAALRPGMVATVRNIAPACQGPQRRRLLDLGLVPGTPVVAEMKSTLGDPVAYRIRGAVIALRRQQAEWVHVDPNFTESEN